MNRSDVADNGAHYFRCDLQVHTPRDDRWVGPQPTDDAGRAAYAISLVDACRRLGLQAIAITDHHDFTFVPYVRAAAQAEVGADGSTLAAVDRLVVFPGLELTLGVPCQALLLFDTDLPDERLPDVLSALSIDPVDPSLPAVPPVQRLAHINSLAALHDLLELRDFLKGRYIVLPNVTDGGHETLMRKGMASKYGDMPCVGGYLDGAIEKIGTGNRRIFDGEDPAWGSKRIAVVQTSDSRHEDHRTLGVPSSWIKWAAPTAEALRQACLAEESRIAHTQPSLPTAVLRRVSVSNSMFLGPVDLELNPQYTAIIGGRGTGKSTILDYLRWALCDTENALPHSDEAGDPAARQRRLIDATLRPLDATVDVEFEINAIRHVVRRRSSSSELTVKIGSGELRTVTESEVRELLPIQGYSQKQLSSVAVRMDELMRFVTSPIRKKLAEIDRSIDDAAARLREIHASLQRRRSLTTSTARLELQVGSLTQQAESLRASLTAVSEEDRSVLGSKAAYDAARLAYETQADTLDRGIRVAERLDELLVEALNRLPVLPSVPTDLVDDLETVDHQLRSALTTFRVAGTAAGDQLKDRANAELKASLSAVEAQLDEFDQRYEEVKARSTAHDEQLAELADLERRQTDASRQLAAQRQELQALGDPGTQLDAVRGGLFDLYGQRSAELEAQCEALSSASGGLLRATLRRGQGLNSVFEALRGAVSGSNLRGSKIEAFFDALRAEQDPHETWQLALSDLENLAQLDGETAPTTESAPTLGRLGFPAADLQRIASKLTSDGWLVLALTRIEDEPEFEYQTRDGEYIAFADASAGQQATALIKVLLGQPGPPLVVDQPEDDLDSQVVLDIVRRIWSAKQQRQLIFTSHNANLVVNGDAELVVCCDYRIAGEQSRGRIKLEGAIDLPEVRDEITTVMEGGEKAFRLRKDKYGF